jgi:hypothetical protein
MLKLQVKRQAIFREAVQVKLDGLPKGVTLGTAALTLPSDRNELDLELRADAKAAPATAKGKLSCSTTIAGMAYTHPPVVVEVAVKAGK